MPAADAAKERAITSRARENNSSSRRPQSGCYNKKERKSLMTLLSKTIIVTSAFAIISSQALSDAAWELRSDMAYIYGGPGKMTAMALSDRNREVMMKRATRVPINTVLFMKNGELYSGTCDVGDNERVC